jgi:hypothetical protein
VLLAKFATKTSPAASVAMLSGSLIPLDSVADGVVDAVTSAGENSSTVLLNAFATKTSPAASVATLSGKSPVDSVRTGTTPAVENSSTVLFP